MSTETQDFITRREFEAWLKVIQDNIDFREKIRAGENNDALFERKLDKQIEDMNAAIEKNKHEIQDIFNKMHEDCGEIKRTIKSIASKLDIINIMLLGCFIFLGFGILALLFIIKNISG